MLTTSRAVNSVVATGACKRRGLGDTRATKNEGREDLGFGTVSLKISWDRSDKTIETSFHLRKTSGDIFVEGQIICHKIPTDSDIGRRPVR